MKEKSKEELSSSPYQKKEECTHCHKEYETPFHDELKICPSCLLKAVELSKKKESKTDQTLLDSFNPTRR